MESLKSPVVQLDLDAVSQRKDTFRCRRRRRRRAHVEHRQRLYTPLVLDVCQRRRTTSRATSSSLMGLEPAARAGNQVYLQTSLNAHYFNLFRNFNPFSVCGGSRWRQVFLLRRIAELSPAVPEESQSYDSPDWCSRISGSTRAAHHTSCFWWNRFRWLAFCLPSLGFVHLDSGLLVV